eukprot:1212638-Rhodomonas_salina.2
MCSVCVCIRERWRLLGAGVGEDADAGARGQLAHRRLAPQVVVEVPDPLDRRACSRHAHRSCQQPRPRSTQSAAATHTAPLLQHARGTSPAPQR